MEWSLFASALVMGFLGSWHCGVMCGPLSCNFKQGKDFSTYHLGRLLSYLAIGSFLFLGSQYFLNVESRPLKVVSSVLFASFFIYFGLRQLNVLKRRINFPVFYQWQFRFLKNSRHVTEKFPVVLGLLTGFFPCGWLYSFLMLAAQMKDLKNALGLIFIFWLTSLPAFFVFNSFLQTLIKKSPTSYQKIAGLILILAGLFSIIGHWAYLIT